MIRAPPSDCRSHCRFPGISRQGASGLRHVARDLVKCQRPVAEPAAELPLPGSDSLEANPSPFNKGKKDVRCRTIIDRPECKGLRAELSRKYITASCNQEGASVPLRPVRRHDVVVWGVVKYHIVYLIKNGRASLDYFSRRNQDSVSTYRSS